MISVTGLLCQILSLARELRLAIKYITSIAGRKIVHKRTIKRHNFVAIQWHNNWVLLCAQINNTDFL